MMSLASKFQNRVRDFQEYRRLIDREKYILDDNLNKLILPDEFFLRAVRPLYDRDAYLSGMFNKIGASLYDCALEGPQIRDSEDYFIPFTHLSHEMQMFYVARGNEQKKWNDGEEINLGNVFPFGEKMRVYPSSRFVIEKLYENFSKEAEPEKRLFRAVPLNYPIALMHVRQSFFTSELSFYENISLAKGEGSEVLDFWRNVNNLTDYSHLFAHKPKPPRKNPPRKPELAKNAGWQPAWGNGF